MKNVFFFFASMFFWHAAKAVNYYIHDKAGNDSNTGISVTTAWKTVEPLSRIRLQPGDSVLFASGQKFSGMLSLQQVEGRPGQPVVISFYTADGSKERPVLDAGNDLNALWIRNSSYITVAGLAFTAMIPYQSATAAPKSEMRCGILVEITMDREYSDIQLDNLVVHDVYYHAAGFKRSAAETATANGTQSYGWGIRFLNNSKTGEISAIKILRSEIYNVCHTGVKITGPKAGITNLEVAFCRIHDTGGPGLQMSGVTGAHVHHNHIDHSGSVADSRNWGRGSGMWTWGCSGILIEHNRFEYANGPGDSAGVHIDFNCSDVVVQYNMSANNAGGFCEILGNNFNCAYRYNISVNDGYRIKGKDGAFQEGKIFWLSGYQGNNREKAGPFNSYFYNNTIYVAAGITPRIAVSSSSRGVLIANNIFFFEKDAILVQGDQKKNETENATITNVVFENNLFLRPGNWPADSPVKDAAALFGDPGFSNKGGLQLTDYKPANEKLISNGGKNIRPIPGDATGLRIGLKVETDIMGNKIKGKPDLGAIELN